MQARVFAGRVVGVLAHPAGRVVPRVVRQREAVGARVQEQLARRRVGVVGDVEHGPRADVDVAVDEHGRLPYRCGAAPDAGSPAAKIAPAARLRKRRPCGNGHEEIRLDDRAPSEPEQRRGSPRARRASSGTRARTRSSGRAPARARASAAASPRRRVHGDACQTGLGERRGESRRGRARRARRARRRVRRDCRGALEMLASSRRGVHGAAAEVVVAAGDQDDRAGRVQREAGGRLGGRRGEHVPDHRRAADRADVLAPQRQAVPAGSAAAMPRRCAGEQRARCRQQPVLAHRATAAAQRPARGRARCPSSRTVRRPARRPAPGSARGPAERQRQDPRRPSRQPARQRRHRRRSRRPSRRAIWNSTMRAFAAR